jgi:hypothetical protein
MFLVSLGLILFLFLGVIGIHLHEMEAHYIPILPSPNAAGAVAETTSTTGPAPARVIQGSERPTVDENEIIHPVHS